MLYDGDFVMSLPQNPIDALISTIDALLKNNARTTEDALNARDLAITLMNFYNYPSPSDVSLEGLDNEQTIVQHFARLRVYIVTQKMQDQSEDQKTRFAALLGATFHYEFSNADIQRIQTLLNEMREFIVKNTQFSDDHRRRILERVEKLQREIHRRLSTVDLFWGLMGEAGVAVGKFGKDAKPFVDRVRPNLNSFGDFAR